MKKLLIFTVFLISAYSYASDSEYSTCDLFAQTSAVIAESVGSKFGAELLHKICHRCSNASNAISCLDQTELLLLDFLEKAEVAYQQFGYTQKFSDYVFKLIISTNIKSHKLSSKSRVKECILY